MKGYAGDYEILNIS